MAVPSPLGDVNIVVSYIDSFMLNAFTLKKSAIFLFLSKEQKCQWLVYYVDANYRYWLDFFGLVSRIIDFNFKTILASAKLFTKPSVSLWTEQVLNFAPLSFI